MTRKAFLALLLALPAAAAASFKAKRQLPQMGWFRSKFMVGLDPAFRKDKAFVVIWARDYANGTYQAEQDS